METPEGQTGEEQLTNNPPTPPPEPAQIIDTPTNEEGSGNQRQEPQTPPQEPVRVIIDKDERQDVHPLIANIISFLTLCAAIAAFVYTYKLFDAANTANETSAKGVAAAITADSISREALKLSQLQYLSQIKKDVDNAIEITNKTIADEMKYRKQFALDSQSTQAQIAALNETKKQFEEENEPYLEIGDIAVKRFEIGKPIIIEYSVKNLSQQTVKEDSAQTAMEYIDKRDYDTFVQNPFGLIQMAKPIKKIQYYVKESPSIGYLYTNTPIAILTKEQFDNFRNGTFFLFIMGKYKYHNTRNFKRKTYEFVIQLHVNADMNSNSELLERTAFDFIKNENRNGWK